MSDALTRIATSVPVNRTAALALSGKGEHYEPGTKIDCLHWQAPPPLPPHPAAVEDLSGKKVGRLTVIGYFGPANRSDGTLWLVRCACGDYEVRRAKRIKKPGDGFQSCRKCGFQHHVKRKVFFDKRGRWPTGEEEQRMGMR